ncbi:MAG: hypothetical protein LBV04_08505 [Deferribacteraceae bacterium]|jgi:hypothetical protein|nr:hypothetical protein [Deferribacteraceae bacterium]
MLGKLFKNKKETVYVQEPNPEKSRQLFYIDISKDNIISKAQEQNISITDSELDLVRVELFNRVVADVQTSLQNNLLAYYSEVAEAVIDAFGDIQVNGYKKVLMGIEIALPTNKSRAESVLITRKDERYSMLFTGQGVHIPLNELSLDDVVVAFSIITGIVAGKIESDMSEAA